MLRTQFQSAQLSTKFILQAETKARVSAMRMISRGLPSRYLRPDHSERIDVTLLSPRLMVSGHPSAPVSHLTTVSTKQQKDAYGRRSYYVISTVVPGVLPTKVFHVSCCRYRGAGLFNNDDSGCVRAYSPGPACGKDG